MLHVLHAGKVTGKREKEETHGACQHVPHLSPLGHSLTEVEQQLSPALLPSANLKCVGLGGTAVLRGWAAAALLLPQAWPRVAVGGWQQPAAPLPGQPRRVGGARGCGSPWKKHGGRGSAGALGAMEAGTGLVRARAMGLACGR